MLRIERASSVHWIEWLKTMVEQPSKMTSFIAELRRRHVFRVAVGYAAFAFVVLQLGEIVLPAFSAEWALQYVVVFAVLGFPVVIVLAWVFDVTTDGIQVTADADQFNDPPSTGTLPRLALMTVTLLAVGGVGAWWVQNTAQGTGAVSTGLGPSVLPSVYDPDEPIRSIAVLPFDNFSANSEQDYFVAGMHEALIARLSQIPEIRVVSRTTVARYATTDETINKTIPEIAQELGVAGIVEGSVARAGDQVRITVQLIHGASDTHTWAQDYLRSFTDVLALQTEVANAIAEEIQAELSMGGDSPASGDTPVLAHATGSEVPAANEAFMKAQFEGSRETVEGLQAALELYSQAVRGRSDVRGRVYRVGHYRVDARHVGGFRSGRIHFEGAGVGVEGVRDGPGASRSPWRRFGWPVVLRPRATEGDSITVRCTWLRLKLLWGTRKRL